MRRIIRAVALFATICAMAIAGLATSAPAAHAAGVRCISVGSSFSSVMTPGHCIKSYNGRYEAVMQHDGNFVLYHSSGGRACWASSWGGGGYHSGDEVIFSSVSMPMPDTEYGLAVGHYVWGYFFSATYRYDNGDFHIGDRSYDVNVNDKGQLWVGYDKIGSC